MTKGQDQRSQNMKEQAYNIIKTKDSRTQRQSNLNKSKEAIFKISPQEFKDHTLGEIVSLKISQQQSWGKWRKWGSYGVYAFNALGMADASYDVVQLSSDTQKSSNRGLRRTTNKAEAKATGEVISSTVPKDNPLDPNLDSWLKALAGKTNENDVTDMQSINSIYDLRELDRVFESQTIFADLRAQIVSL
ncbi:hypothetical protein Tco_0590257 [Tanacetum coccineum]